MKYITPGPVTIMALFLLASACQAIDSDKPLSYQTDNTPKADQSELLSEPHLQIAAVSFEIWIAQFKDQAIAQGISASTANSAFRGVSLNQRVIELDQRQPEFTKPIWEYLEGAVSTRRIRQGQKLLNQHRQLLEQIRERYRVPPEYLVAIWGLESDYGRVFGNFNVIEVLATLGYQGRRQSFGHEQLMAALRIIDRGDIPADQMVGSWAGAMGHTQFIPTTFLDYAVDFDGDGRRDLWHSIPDALASTAHYLAEVGHWKESLKWGYEVTLPENFNWDLSDSDIHHPLEIWQRYGVRLPGRQPLPALAASTTLIAPAGHRGPAFLVTDNFQAIMRYNNATSYALAVSHMADRFSGSLPFQTSWPTGLEPLSRNDKKDLQRLLANRGYDPGGVDGIVGPRTRAAVRHYQKEVNLPNDGFPTQELLEQLRKSSL